MLESLLAQDWPAERPPVRLLLVDDGSTDDSANLAREIAGDRLEIELSPEPRGIGGNWNRCAELAIATGADAFCLAHQDDIYAPTFLVRLAAALEAQADAGIAHCRATAIDQSGQPVDSGAERYKQHFWRDGPQRDRAAQYRRLWNGNFVCCPAVLYRASAFSATGTFRTDLRFALDWEYWFRLLRTGHGIADVDEALVEYRRHPTAATRVATSDRWRFEEELQVLDEARREGIAAGLLAATAGPSPALRNNLLHEALTDLERGDHRGARKKLEFVRDHAPELWRDFYVRTFRTLTRLGPPGRVLLGVCRGLAIRYGLGGASG